MNLAREKVILDAMDQIYDKYSFMHIDKNVYEQLVSSVYFELVSHDKHDDMNKCILDKVEQVVLSYIRDYIKKQNNLVDVISEYMRMKVKSVRSYRYSLYELKKLTGFLTDLDETFDFDFYLDVVKANSKIFNMLSFVVNKNQEFIESGLFDCILDDAILSNFIEAYCMIKDIRFGTFSRETDICALFDKNADGLVEVVSEENRRFAYPEEVVSPLLTREEERELGQRILNHDLEARDILVEKNISFVLKLATRLLNGSLDYWDLVQEGSIGLVEAANRYDVTKGVSFLSYAQNYILHYMVYAIQKDYQNNAITFREASNIRKFLLESYSLKQKMGIDPTVDEVAESLGMDVSEVRELQRLSKLNVSIHDFVDSDGNEVPGTPYIDGSVLEEQVMDRVIASEVVPFFKQCKVKERDIHILLLRGQGFELRYLAQMFGISFQRIQQIVTDKIKMVQDSECAKQFKKTYDL